jgi:hypothetical protein
MSGLKTGLAHLYSSTLGGSMMDRNRKIELIQRSLGIRHKLRVHDSMKAPDTHEDLALMLLGKWELEDELRAIEEVLTELRNKNVAHRKELLLIEDAQQRREQFRKLNK